MDGRDVLAYIKGHPNLKTIPTVILSSSAAQRDVFKSYELQANCYLVKPVDWEHFREVVESINDFWLTKVKLPGKRDRKPGLVQDLHSQQMASKGRQPMYTAKIDRMPKQLLLVEDNPGDVRLTREAFREANMEIHLHVASDGVEAMAFLRNEDPHASAPRPDLILLDLNLPLMGGREVLAQIKQDESLKTIPTIILTTSDADIDIARSYELHANCYLSKPVELNEFEAVIKSINHFWLSQVELPGRAQRV
jgi:two-component system, chemotaxis family, response regulator Rcp1